jgi:hypothetical protein
VAQNGYRRTGIFPINRNVFEDYEFASAIVTDNAYDDASEVVGPVDINQDIQGLVPVVETADQQQPTNCEIPDPQVACSMEHSSVVLILETADQQEVECLVPVIETADQLQPGSSEKVDTQIVGPFKLSPPPKQQRASKKRNCSRKGKTAILTSNPYKEMLLDKLSLQGTKKIKKSAVINAKTPELERIISDKESSKVTQKRKVSGDKGANKLKRK